MIAKPKLSIIVPVYNVEQYLRECLDSIKSQTFTDFEVLLINDGSPDKSGSICDEYAAKDSRFKVWHKENGGVSSARNLGLDNAQGEWIGFVDSDDYLLYDNVYEDIFKNVESGDYDIITFGYSTPTNDVLPSNYGITKNKLGKYDIFYNFFSFYGVWTSLFLREKINDLRFSDIKIGEDTLFVRLFLLNKSVKSAFVINKSYYLYRDNMESAMNTMQPASMGDRAFLISSLYNYIVANKIGVDMQYFTREAVFYFFVSLKEYSRGKDAEFLATLMKEYAPEFNISKILTWDFIFENKKPRLGYLMIKLKMYKAAAKYLKHSWNN